MSCSSHLKGAHSRRVATAPGLTRGLETEARRLGVEVPGQARDSGTGSTRRGLILGLLALGGCGFAPLYGAGAPATRLEGAFSIPVLETPFGFALREQLLTRLGGDGPARYRLALATTVTSDERAIRGDNTISRFTLEGTARYTIEPLSGGASLTRGNVRSFTAYSAVGSPFATRAAEDDARRRLAVALADQIVLRLAATAADWTA